MFIDARELAADTVVETEVCIIGAGPAGTTLAREFIGQNFKVCLLESGGIEPDENTQSLCQGEVIEDLNQNLSESRSRQFGGTANRWNVGENQFGARLLPLDKIDFEKRDWLPYSGWPFGKSHLDPFYERAQHLCRLKPFAYDASDWEDEQTPRLPFAENRITTTMYQTGLRNVFTQELRGEINESSNITTYLNANVVEIETNDPAKTVTRVRVACLQGNTFWVAAKVFILATGGIENARLLLQSNKTQSVGLGNQNDLVGRFFMEHALFRLGVFTPSDPQIFESAALYDVRLKNNILVMGKLTITEEVMRCRQLLNSCMLLFPKTKAYESKAIKSLKTLLSASRRAEIPKDALNHLSNVIRGIDDTVSLIYGHTFKLKEFSYSRSQGGWSSFKNKGRFKSFEVRVCTEQAPSPDIRVTLGSERDRLGLRKVQPISWRWSDLEIHSLVKVQQILREEIADAGLGQFQSWVELDGSPNPPQCVGGNHHMGTTRMHIDPKQGVVDENCQIHDVTNLFIAGSSVFPTGGAANPTLTIIALAIRLADHVKKVMASDVTTINSQLLSTLK